MRVLRTMVSIGVLLSAGVCRAADPPTQSGPCVDVRVGAEHVSDLDCINQNLRGMAAQQQGLPQAAPVATGSSVAVGTANVAAARQMMGNAFGKSAQPQRPHPTFISPLPGAPAAH